MHEFNTTEPRGRKDISDLEPSACEDVPGVQMMDLEDESDVPQGRCVDVPQSPPGDSGLVKRVLQIER